MQASCFGYIKVKELEVSGLLSQRKINASTFPAGMMAAGILFLWGGNLRMSQFCNKTFKVHGVDSWMLTHVVQKDF